MELPDYYAALRHDASSVGATKCGETTMHDKCIPANLLSPTKPSYSLTTEHALCLTYWSVY